MRMSEDFSKKCNYLVDIIDFPVALYLFGLYFSLDQNLYHHLAIVLSQKLTKLILSIESNYQINSKFEKNSNVVAPLLLKEHQTGKCRFDALLRRSIRACYLILCFVIHKLESDVCYTSLSFFIPPLLIIHLLLSFQNVNISYQVQYFHHMSSLSAHAISKIKSYHE